jgi:CheY-like chemotaxis protein
LFDPQNCCRVLVIDDDRDTHELLRRMLIKSNPTGDEHVSSYSQMPCFEVDSAYQGEEGLGLVGKSLQQNRPYSLAFVDVRMPPGWDGIETIRKIWEKYRDLQVVICTAYSDYSWGDMVENLGHLDRIVILNKPFEKSRLSNWLSALLQNGKVSSVPNFAWIISKSWFKICSRAEGTPKTEMKNQHGKASADGPPGERRSDEAEERTRLAEQRTELAEERTELAEERSRQGEERRHSEKE